jgi:hypothetical protein
MASALQPFGPGIWTAEGPVVPFLPGFPYPTRMAVIRLASGGLFVWSPVELTREIKTEVDALGPVRHLVAPNKLHHLYLGAWRVAYPEARLYGPPGLAAKRPDLVFDGELTDRPPPAWADEIDQVVVGGSVAMTEVVFFHRPSGTAIFADLIENLPADWFGTGWKRLLARLDGILAPNPGAPREWRWSFLGRAKARDAIRRVLAWPIDKALIAHGEPARDNGAAFVRQAFSWLIPPT